MGEQQKPTSSQELLPAPTPACISPHVLFDPKKKGTRSTPKNSPEQANASGDDEIALIGAGLALAAGAALDALGYGTVDVVGRDPAGIEPGLGARGNARGLGRRGGLDNLGALALLGGLGPLGLGEQGLDPGLVDKVDSAAKDAGQDEVEEDAISEGTRPPVISPVAQKEVSAKNMRENIFLTSGGRKCWWEPRQCWQCHRGPGAGTSGRQSWR